MFGGPQPPSDWLVASCTRCRRTIYSAEIQKWDFIWRNEWSIEGTCKECSEELLQLEMDEAAQEEECEE
jgi:hypothetical protein